MGVVRITFTAPSHSQQNSYTPSSYKIPNVVLVWFGEQTWHNPHEEVSAGPGPAGLGCRQLLKRVEGVEVDKVGAAQAGDDRQPASVERQTEKTTGSGKPKSFYQGDQT